MLYQPSLYSVDWNNSLESMRGDSEATVFIGNLDEEVDERVLYEIMIQAGPLVELHIPRDKDAKRHKGYGFAEYMTQADAQYAIKLFTGLVCIHNKPLRFGISGQDKSSQKPSPKRASRTSLNRHTAGAQMNSGGCLALYPPGFGYSPAYKSSGAKNNNGRMKNGPYIRRHVARTSIAEEAQKWNCHLSSKGEMGLRSSVCGSAYTHASPSYWL